MHCDGLTHGIKDEPLSGTIGLYPNLDIRLVGEHLKYLAYVNGQVETFELMVQR